MGRREQRAELESSWTVLEPRVPGTPFRAKDIRDAYERPVLESAAETSAESNRPPDDGASPSAADLEIGREEHERSWRCRECGCWTRGKWASREEEQFCVTCCVP